MKISYELPLHKVEAGAEFVSGPAVAEMARALEAAGVDACYVTDHPAPPDHWLEKGGHHSPDPFVALSFAAAATNRLRLHTNIIVLPYRNPFLLAKMVSTLDVLSGGRLIMGIGSGYLEAEFAALGAPFANRGAVMDEALTVMELVWTGRSVSFSGQFFKAEGMTALPPPIQRPRPPIWVGGNSDRAIRRAVESCDGWSPFPVKGRGTQRVRTAEIAGMDDLKARIAYAREIAVAVGRAAPFDIAMVPFSFMMSAQARPDRNATIDELNALAEAGVTWSVVSLPARTRAEYLDNVAWFGSEIRPAL